MVVKYKLCKWNCHFFQVKILDILVRALCGSVKYSIHFCYFKHIKLYAYFTLLYFEEFCLEELSPKNFLTKHFLYAHYFFKSFSRAFNRFCPSQRKCLLSHFFINFIHILTLGNRIKMKTEILGQWDDLAGKGAASMPNDRSLIL